MKLPKVLRASFCKKYSSVEELIKALETVDIEVTTKRVPKGYIVKASPMSQEAKLNFGKSLPITTFAEKRSEAITLCLVRVVLALARYLKTHHGQREK